MFKSAVDGWFYAVILILVVTLLASFVPFFSGGASASDVLMMVVISLVSLGLPLWLLFATDYRVDAGTLRIRSGPFRWTLPLEAITKVEATRSLLSSPALSLDRLRISYDQGRSLLVSPADRDGFLQAIGKPLEH